MTESQLEILELKTQLTDYKARAAELEEKYRKALEQLNKTEHAITKIMLNFKDEALCAEIAQEALNRK